MRYFTFLLLLALVGKLYGEKPTPVKLNSKVTEDIMRRLKGEDYYEVISGLTRMDNLSKSFRYEYFAQKYDQGEMRNYNVVKIPESDMKRMRDQVYRLLSDKRDVPEEYRKSPGDVIRLPVYLSAVSTLIECTDSDGRFRAHKWVLTEEHGLEVIREFKATYRRPWAAELTPVSVLKEWYVANYGEIVPEDSYPPIPEVKEQPKETSQEKKTLERKKEESEHLQQENLQLSPLPSIEDYEDKPSPRQEPEVKKPTLIQEPEPKPDKNDTQARTSKPSTPEKQSTNWSTWAFGIIMVTPLIGFALRRYKASA